MLILGSDVYRYPYYLKSIAQILGDANHDGSIADLYGEDLDEIDVDPAIEATLSLSKWLCFSECMNNGGTSRLYIDFDPAPGGTPGQIVRFLHDPDGYAVISDSFEHYLRDLMDQDYAFLFEDDDADEAD